MLKKLYRSDGKEVEPSYFNYIGVTSVETFCISQLNFSNIFETKNITKEIIINYIYKNETKLELKNKYLNFTASLSKNSIRKMISTIFGTIDNDIYGYRIKKELISNIIPIFYNAIPICMHPELKYGYLFDRQVIYRFALPVRINNTDYFIMLTAKGLNDELNITKISIYDFRSKKALDRLPYTLEKCTHSQEHTYMITCLYDFVNSMLEKYR